MNFLSYSGLQRFWTKVKSYVDTKIANSSGDKVNYSIEERVVGTWVDGRPVYEKSYSRIINYNHPNDKACNISLEEGNHLSYIDNILFVSGSLGFYRDLYEGSSDRACIIPIGSDSMELTVIYTTNGSHRIYATLTRRYFDTSLPGGNNAKLACTIRYTKTTDL